MKKFLSETRFFYIFCLTLLGLLTLIFAQTARGQKSNTIFGCIKNGDLRLVDSLSNCRRNETPISWNVQGPQGPQGIPGQPGIQGPAGFKLAVYDSEDKELGIAFDSTQVARRSGSYWILFEVFPFGIRQFSVPIGSNQLGEVRRYYESSDCSGQALMEVRGMMREGKTSGNRVFFGGDPVQPRLFRSTRNNPLESPQNDTGNCQSLSGGINGAAGPVEWMDVSGFAPPFRLQSLQ